MCDDRSREFVRLMYPCIFTYETLALCQPSFARLNSLLHVDRTSSLRLARLHDKVARIR